MARLDVRPRLSLALIALAAIAVAGIGISVYLTSVHYAKTPLVCSSNGIVNCERVLSSRYSSVAGVPVSVGGIVWFAVSGLLVVIGLFAASEPRWLQPAQVLWSLVGLVTVLYLVGVEAIALGVLCAWCTALHVLIVGTLLISLLRTPRVTKTERITAGGAAQPSPAPRLRGSPRP